MDLAERMPVVATEDIFDTRGNKLLAKGAKVTTALQERLILHKLTRPIEMSLSVAGGVDARLIARTAERLIGACAALRALVDATRDNGPSPVAILAPLEFGNAVTMMLTIVDRGGEAALDHAVMVAVISVCMAKAVRLPEQDQRNCALAGLLHDIGELYVNPIYLQPGRVLAPHEWAHLVVHPKTAQMLVDELESFPKSVGQAIAEHHERRDGSGYPRRLTGTAISSCGQVLAVAEAISGLLLTLLLEMSGYVVQTAKDFSDASWSVAAFQPHVIVTELAGVGGIDIAQRLKQLPQAQNAHVVALTSLYWVGIETDALEAGFVQYMLKPVPVNALIRNLRSLVRLPLNVTAHSGAPDRCA